MQSNKYYRDLYNNPFPTRMIKEELFGNGETSDGYPAVQQAVHNLISDLGSRFALINDVTITSDGSDISVGDRYTLLSGVLSVSAADTLIGADPGVGGTYLYMNITGGIGVTGDIVDALQHIVLARVANGAVTPYFTRGYHLDTSPIATIVNGFEITGAFIDHESALIKRFNSVEVIGAQYNQGYHYYNSGAKVIFDTGATNLYREVEGMLITDADFTVGGGNLELGADCEIYRQAENIIRTPDAFRVGGTLAVSGNTTLGDANSDTETFRGTVTLTDNSSSYPLNLGADVNLYRAGENVLKTDDVFYCAGATLYGTLNANSQNIANVGNLYATFISPASSTLGIAATTINTANGAANTIGQLGYTTVNAATLNVTTLNTDTISNVTTNKPTKVGNTWYCNTAAKWNYIWNNTLVHNGDTIILSGSWESTSYFNINKSVTIIGNKLTTIYLSHISASYVNIYGTSITAASTFIEITGNYITIDGCKIRPYTLNHTRCIGIERSATTEVNITINNCDISTYGTPVDNFVAIYISATSTNTISGIKITNNRFTSSITFGYVVYSIGLEGGYLAFSTISGNSIWSNATAYCYLLFCGSGTQFSYSSVSNNYCGGSVVIPRVTVIDATRSICVGNVINSAIVFYNGTADANHLI